MVVASLVLLHELLASEALGKAGSKTVPVVIANVMPYVLLALALLMVSNLRFVHVGNTYLRGRRPFEQFVVFVIVLGVFLYRPVLTLVVVACAYAGSGPASAVMRWLRGKPSDRPTATGAEPNADPESKPADRTG
jgi:phosphatidylserine synthase